MCCLTPCDFIRALRQGATNIRRCFCETGCGRSNNCNSNCNCGCNSYVDPVTPYRTQNRQNNCECR